MNTLKVVDALFQVPEGAGAIEELERAIKEVENSL